MNEFIKVGDSVIVSNEGKAGNYGGLGRVTEVASEWFKVAPVCPVGNPNWDIEWHFVPSRVKLAPPLNVRGEGQMLGFASGATRNRKENELQYEGFVSPLALQMFAEYMHEHRHTADGSVRDSDNWQKGIPDESYRDSLLRHVMDLWLIYRGWDEQAREDGDLRKALAGAYFNVQGLMHNLALRDLEKKREVSQ